jgi:Flp pilus assembly protein TadG
MTYRALANDARGVVMLEFLVAFVPVLLLFLGAVQLALLSVAELVVRHAAIAGARSAAVVLDDDPARYENEARGDLLGARRQTITRAVQHPLSALPGTTLEVTAVAFPVAPGSSELAVDFAEDSETVTVRVIHLARCSVPIVRALCAPITLPDGITEDRFKPLQAEATMPRFRARYRYPSEPARGDS